MRHGTSVFVVVWFLLPAVGCGDDDGGGNNNANANGNGICGDGHLDSNEECDEGAQNSDVVPNACRSNCRAARCGDEVIDDGEECDTGNLDGATCGSRGFTKGNLACTSGCVYDESDCTTCGDNVAEDGVTDGAGRESCDGTDLREMDCVALGRSTGVLACSQTCEWNFSGCTGASTCGNNVVEASEACDDGNTIGCDGCSSTCLWEECGNGLQECAEACDLGALNSDAPNATCRTDCTPKRCGDGVVDTGEACDDGASNSDTVPNACRTNCETATCGDGIIDLGETCDNGASNSDTVPNACRTSCAPASCGDGVTDQDEQCDCGTDLAALPTGCYDVNGGAEASSCTVTCEAIPCNVVSYHETCDPLVLRDCCEDDWGVQPICTIVPPGSNPTCERQCAYTMDCFWSNFCSATLGNVCWPETCGIAQWPNTQVNAPCTVSGGGGEGYCWPIYPRSAADDVSTGVCMEAGTLAHGHTCNAVDIMSADRSESVCSMGFCSAAWGSPTGTCKQFCDWEKAYVVAFYGAAANTEPLPCPNGANCFAESIINDTTGIRSGDMAYCFDTEATDPTHGMTTCSLVTSQLLSNPTQTCTDAGFTDGRCVLVQLPSGTTYGALVGVCMDGTAAPNLNVWDTCDPANQNQVCPSGSTCLKTDLFATTPTQAERCVPFCDTAHPAGIQQHCADLGAQPTTGGVPVCRSMSYLFPPDGPNDTSKTRLGLCATN